MYPRQTHIQRVEAARLGPDLRLSWESTEPAGTWFHVYVDARVAWRGTERRCIIPAPGGSRRQSVEVVAVGPADAGTSVASSLTLLGSRARLSWGEVEGADHYEVFMGATAGATPSLASAPVATVRATTAVAGWGVGGWGWGGWGVGVVERTWTSGPLPAGVWKFKVRAVSPRGDAGAATDFEVTISVPPQAPPPFADGARLKINYNPATRGGTLLWNPSTP
jgi:hypothetical protein